MLRATDYRRSELQAVTQRVADMKDVITELMAIGGTAGVALGVLHHGEVIPTKTFGYRDIASKLPIDDETVFAGASLTKAVVSAGIGILVEEGKVDWDTPVKHVLKEFKTLDSTLENLTTITDILSHRTGMSTSNYWLGSENNVLIDLKDSMKFLNNQRLVKPFRGQFEYNNLGYELAGHVIEELTGATWSDFLQSRILQPLDMKRTSFRAGVVQDDNVAKAYGTLDDGSPTHIPDVKMDDEHFGGANGGIRTCIKDLLKLYTSLFHAARHQFGLTNESEYDTPIKQAARLLSSNIALEPQSFHEQSYAAGWARVQLPGPMGAVGLNPKLMRNAMPLVGKNAASRLVFYHQGSLPGVLAAVNLVPETESAVVVLTNSLALNDCADWIGQAVLEALLDVPNKNDYIQMAKDSVAAALSWYPNLVKEIDSERSGSPPRQLSDYVGTFFNDIRTYKVVISLSDDQLSVAFQGLESEKFSLTYIRDDEFSWLQPRNELARRGRFTHQEASYYKIRFHADQAGIQGLSWTHDADVPEGEKFTK